MDRRKNRISKQNHTKKKKQKERFADMQTHTYMSPGGTLLVHTEGQMKQQALPVREAGALGGGKSQTETHLDDRLHLCTNSRRYETP